MWGTACLFAHPRFVHGAATSCNADVFAFAAAQVKKAIEGIFKVKVADVTTVKNAGKNKRVGQRLGRRSDWKKAYVTLKPGEKIAIFEGA